MLPTSSPRNLFRSQLIESKGTMTDIITVSESFDGGNIKFVGIVDGEVHVEVKDDIYTELETMYHKQWFYFRASGFSTSPDAPETKFVLANAGTCSYPDAWEGFNVVTSYDRKDWFRTPSSYDETKGHLQWTLKVKSNQVYFAFFAPYSHERHLDLIGKCAALSANPTVSLKNHSEVTVRSLGNTLDGRSMDLITIGNGPLKVWAIARQHPGETMAEWFMEGYINRLIDENDPIVRQLRRDATFYCVPNMNPDGAFRGHLRTNACGANLNREWCTTGDYIAPTLERSPEVYHVLAEMTRIGVDFSLDVHGDEALPYNFLSGSEGVKKWGPRLKHLQDKFAQSFRKASPDFQSEHGYDKDKPNKANLSIASTHIGQQFDCLSATLEMPFKDTIDDPNPLTGWSPDRSMHLGAAVLEAIRSVLPELRAEK